MSVSIEFRNMDNGETVNFPYNQAGAVIPSMGQHLVSPFNDEKIATVAEVVGDPASKLVILIYER